MKGGGRLAETTTPGRVSACARPAEVRQGHQGYRWAGKAASDASSVAPSEPQRQCNSDASRPGEVAPSEPASRHSPSPPPAASRQPLLPTPPRLQRSVIGPTPPRVVPAAGITRPACMCCRKLHWSLAKAYRSLPSTPWASPTPLAALQVWLYAANGFRYAESLLAEGVALRSSHHPLPTPLPSWLRLANEAS